MAGLLSVHNDSFYFRYMTEYDLSGCPMYQRRLAANRCLFVVKRADQVVFEGMMPQVRKPLHSRHAERL
jgi:hypothetical protein